MGKKLYEQNDINQAGAGAEESHILLKKEVVTKVAINLITENTY